LPGVSAWELRWLAWDTRQGAQPGLAGVDADGLDGQPSSTPSRRNRYSVQEVFKTERGRVLQLPEPDRSRLTKSPLDLVVAQVRFDQRVDVSTPKVGFGFQKILADSPDRAWRVEPIEGPRPIDITVTREGPQVSTGEQLRGWRFTAPDDAYILVLMPDSIAIETRDYTEWSDFRPTAERAIGCLTEEVGPEIELRVGLRYVDRLRDDSIDSAAGWAANLQPPLHGLFGDERLGPAVLNQQQQIILRVNAACECRFAHGTLPTEHGLEYVLDYDLYRQDARPFGAASVMEALDLFNTEALKLFQASVTQAKIEELR
jgi:uncharacterized protein (TIGR04255 family)